MSSEKMEIPIPAWAESMVKNYRYMFKGKHNRESTLTDAQIWLICNTIYDDSSSAIQDEARVEEMLAQEKPSV